MLGDNMEDRLQIFREYIETLDFSGIIESEPVLMVNQPDVDGFNDYISAFYETLNSTYLHYASDYLIELYDMLGYCKIIQDCEIALQTAWDRYDCMR